MKIPSRYPLKKKRQYNTEQNQKLKLGFTNVLNYKIYT